MLTDDELDAMRDTIDDSYADDVTISRPGTAVDSEGNPTMALTTVATTTGWLTHIAGRGFGVGDVVSAGQDVQRNDRVLLVPYGTDIGPGDVVTIDAVRWRITAAHLDRLHVRCDVVNVEG